MRPGRVMKPISQTKALARLKTLKDDFKEHISDTFEHRATSCLTCETQGACCLDAHFVNVHISRLEAVAIRQTIAAFSENMQAEINTRVEAAIEKYALAGRYRGRFFDESLGGGRPGHHHYEH